MRNRETAKSYPRQHQENRPKQMRPPTSKMMGSPRELHHYEKGYDGKGEKAECQNKG